MFATAETFQEIVVRLSVLRYVITSNTKRGALDIARDAEDFFAQFLNITFGWKLLNLNCSVQRNHPAIDLGDSERRIAVQVTADNSKKKVKDTLEKFAREGLGTQYNKLFILILSNRKQDANEFTLDETGLNKLTIWDIDELLAEVERMHHIAEIGQRGTDVIGQLEKLTRRELPSIVRETALTRGPDNLETKSVLCDFAIVDGHPAKSARSFIDASFGPLDDNDRASVFADIGQLFEKLRDEATVATRVALLQAVRSSSVGESVNSNFANLGSNIFSNTDLVLYMPNLQGSWASGGMRLEEYRNLVTTLQFNGWAWPHEDYAWFAVIWVSLPSMEANFALHLKRFVRGDLRKLAAILVDLDFRHLD